MIHSFRATPALDAVIEKDVKKLSKIVKKKLNKSQYIILCLSSMHGAIKEATKNN